MATNSVLEDLLKDFLMIAQCSEDIGKFYLKENNYILQDAVNQFFEKGCMYAERQITKEEDSDCEIIAVKMAQAESIEESCPASSTFKLITWNIDGLDEEDLKMRTLQATSIINSHNPDVVYLQEVIVETLKVIQRMCRGYKIHVYMRAPYFCAILLKNTPALKFVSKNVIEYPGSTMGRYLLCVNITYNNNAITLMTSHLESTKDKAVQRKVQLEECFSKMQECSSAVILGGDLNIRDYEIASIGGLPTGVEDAWEKTGSDYSKKFTWDVSENDNLDWEYSHKPKLRFDRVLYKSGEKEKMEAQNFELIGKRRMDCCERFVSDHWGILCEFSVTK